MNNAQEFRSRAQEVGAEDIYQDAGQEFRMFEDDGNFFIEHFGLRAAWSFGQESTRSQFNRSANRVLESMGYSQRYAGTGRV